MLNKTTKGKLGDHQSTRRFQELSPIMVTSPIVDVKFKPFLSQRTPRQSKLSPTKTIYSNVQSTINQKSKLKPLNLLGLLQQEEDVIFQRPANLGEIVEDKTIQKLRGTRDITQLLSTRNIDVNLFQNNENNFLSIMGTEEKFQLQTKESAFKYYFDQQVQYFE